MKTTFNPVGLQALLKQLYALNEAELKEEVAQLHQNFKKWLRNHFDFTDKQLGFLEQTNHAFLEKAKIVVGRFIGIRMPILMIKNKQELPLSKSDGEGDNGKILDLDEKKKVSYNPSIGYMEEESLLITINYYQA